MTSFTIMTKYHGTVATKFSIDYRTSGLGLHTATYFKL